MQPSSFDQLSRSSLRLGNDLAVVNSCRRSVLVDDSAADDRHHDIRTAGGVNERRNNSMHWLEMNLVDVDHCDISQFSGRKDTGVDAEKTSSLPGSQFERLLGVGGGRVKMMKTLHKDRLFHLFEHVLTMVTGRTVRPQ